MAQTQKHSAEILPIKSAPEKAAQKKARVPGLAPVFEVRETTLCAQLNLSKDEVRRRRQYFLTEGQHWEYVDKRVLLSRIGAEILRGTRNAIVPVAEKQNAATADSASRRSPVALLCEKNPPPVAFEGKLLTWAMPNHNKKVVVCYLPGTDPQNPMNLVTLRVRDNGNFMRGMEIPPAPKGKVSVVPRVTITPVKERNDVYDLQGALPRWRGKW